MGRRLLSEFSTGIGEQYNLEKVREVSFPGRELRYSIITRQNILEPRNTLLHDLVRNRRCLIIVDKHYSSSVYPEFCDHIARYFGIHGKLVRIAESFDSGAGHGILFLERSDIVICTSDPISEDGGEKKNIESVISVIEYALRCDLPRNGLLIGIGGGVTLDTVGLAAALYRRMIDYIRIPTTLVGQIDAGIGLKVGVNYAKKKNILGTFYPPQAVINDISFLSTLPDLEIACGIAEIIKIGISHDERILIGLEDVIAKRGVCGRLCYVQNAYKEIVASELFPPIMDMAICSMLAELGRSPFENETRRKVDFGHTFSQAMETLSRYRIPHGVAVGIDMYLCICISYMVGLINRDLKDRYLRLLEIFGLTILPYVDGNDFFDSHQDLVYLDGVRNAMQHRRGHLNLVVPVAREERVGFISISDTCTDSETEVILLEYSRLEGCFKEAILALRHSGIRRDF